MLLHQKISRSIEDRISVFRSIIRDGSNEAVFCEMVFCLLTAQSDARRCWSAVERLRESGLLFKGDTSDIAGLLRGHARFHNTKAERIVLARETHWKNGRFPLRREIEEHGDIKSMRDRLSRIVNGYGYKEASHFLRNIGLVDDCAILDRHIMRVMVDLKLIGTMPISLNIPKYIEMENTLYGFAATMQIPFSHIDLLFWYRQKEELFK